MIKRKPQIAVHHEADSDFGTVVRTQPPSENRLPSVQPFLWCFCKFCGRQTEYAIAIEATKIFKRLDKGSAKVVQLTASMWDDAQSVADRLVAQYEEAISQPDKPHTAAKMLMELCNIRKMRGDFSVESFRDQVEQRALLVEWAKYGDLQMAARLPGPQVGAQRPSKLYCSLHYPGRNADARRAYQRDRRFVGEYEELLREFWCQYAGQLRQWNIDDHALVRDAAYHHLRLMKAPTRVLDEYAGQATTADSQSTNTALRPMSIDDYYAIARSAHYRLRRRCMTESMDWIDAQLENGVPNQSGIARYLGVRRQAVSAALKRQAVR